MSKTLNLAIDAVESLDQAETVLLFEHIWDNCLTELSREKFRERQQKETESD